MTNSATIYWIRRDLRLGDNPALVEAINRGGPVIPVVINDDIQSGLGAASAYRMSMGFEAMDKSLRALGSRIIYRSGNPVDVLTELVRETGADSVYWSRLYDPESVERDTVERMPCTTSADDWQKIKSRFSSLRSQLRRISGLESCLSQDKWTIKNRARGPGSFENVQR